MSSKLSGYGHTAGESMGGTGANMNQQHGGSGGGVHWGGGSGHGNSGGSTVIRQAGAGQVLKIRMYRLMLMLTGRLILPSRTVW